ncbi:MAG: hypothetical protein GXO37_05090 [Chloroflexi bacterium]|nr:hypothetical protein [Chloroflexota bacterium]
MPLSDEVRNLLEFSIELLVIGGGLPSLFLQRPAWLRELRQRYSVWRAIPGLNRIDALAVVPPILGIVVLFHLCIAAGWCPWDETVTRTVFYASLFIAFIFVAVLWYQVRMTAFTQATLRMFWLAWYMLRKSSPKPTAVTLPSAINGRDNDNDEPTDEASLPEIHESPHIPGCWNRCVAWLQSHLVPRKPEEWRTKVIRDLGRLGANTRTPQETVFVLKALGNLAYVVPVTTSGKESALAQLTEATSRTLWPLEASDQEAFERAIRVFENVLKRWTEEKGKLLAENDERSGIMAESPLMPHLYRLGREILNHFPLLTKRYLKMFTPHDDVRDNNSEAHLLFLLGLQATGNEQWEPLLYILEKLREYTTCTFGPNMKQDTGQKPRCVRSMPGYNQDDDLQWLEKCEPTLWFLGLVAYLQQHTSASWPWLRKYLIRLWPWDEGDEARQELRCALEQAQRFFTTVVFQPETAHAVACLAQRLFPEDKVSQAPWNLLCDDEEARTTTTPARDTDRGGVKAA